LARQALAAVIDDNDIEIGQCLGFERPETIRQDRARPKRRNNDGDSGFRQTPILARLKIGR